MSTSGWGLLRRGEFKKLIKHNGKKVVFGVEPRIERASHIQGGPFFDPGLFSWVPGLEARWREIREEVDQVLGGDDEIPYFHEIQEDQKRIAGDRKWRTFFLYAYGYRSIGNCNRVPITDALVRSIPGMSTAFFSILSPGKHIPEHRGPYKGVLRYHLGLKVPEQAERCRIRVGEEWRHWEEGRSLLFDDTYPHEVRNETEDERVVLFLDILRPMDFPWSALNRGVISAIGRSPYVKDAVRNQLAWEREAYGNRGGMERFRITKPESPGPRSAGSSEA